jgi:hypothetical protein
MVAWRGSLYSASSGERSGPWSNLMPWAIRPRPRKPPRGPSRRSAASEERSPSLASFGPGAGVANRSGSTNYFGGVGVESGAPIVPQRGQCAQATFIGDWQELQVRGAYDVKKRPDPAAFCCPRL